MTAVTLEPVAPRALDNGRMTTLVGSVAVFNIGLELTIIALALPAIAEDFPGASPATLSWIFTAYNVTVASLLLLFGWAAERHGRKRIFTLGLMVFGFGSLTSGLAPTIALLIVGRVVDENEAGHRLDVAKRIEAREFLPAPGAGLGQQGYGGAVSLGTVTEVLAAGTRGTSQPVISTPFQHRLDIVAEVFVPYDLGSTLADCLDRPVHIGMIALEIGCLVVFVELVSVQTH